MDANDFVGVMTVKLYFWLAWTRYIPSIMKMDTCLVVGYIVLNVRKLYCWTNTNMENLIIIL